MRDPKRIDPTLAKVKELWEKYPDLRLGQLIQIVTDAAPTRAGIFNIEDDVLVETIDIMIEGK